MRETKKDSLVMVSSEQQKAPARSNVILPQTLLRYSREIADQSYVIRDLHQLSEKLPEDENIYILSHNVTEDFPKHRHGYYEMNYVYQGDLVNVIDGNEIYMSEGQLAIVNPRGVQSLRCLGGETLILNFCLHRECFDRTLKAFYEDRNPVSDFLRDAHKNKRNYMFFSMEHDVQAQSIVSNIIQEYADARFHQSYALEALFILLFTHLVRTGEYSYYGMDEQALRTVQYIKEKCLSASIAQIASQLGYNPSYLAVYVKKHTGRNCRDILQEARLKEALRQLAETDYDIYDIAENCGYSSPSHFFRIFREKFGLTPGEYRKSLW
ncbi:MAG: AraC family transcriptional regulator [Lachnospiraceae bacterium]|nr:AraC family transcriptional regulator [Lachnospiraceae bacterium]